MKCLRRPLLAFLLALLCMLSACGSVPAAEGSAAAGVFPTSKLHSTSGFAEGMLYYQTMDSATIRIHAYGAEQDRVKNLGKVKDYTMDSGSAAYLDGALYGWYTVSGEDDKLQSVLYRADADGGKLTEVAADQDCSPLIYVRASSAGLLSLKSDEHETWIECYDPQTDALSVVLTQKEREAILQMDTSPDGNSLYLIIKANQDSGSIYQLKTYSVSDWKECAEPVSLSGLAADIIEGSLYDARVLGNCLYLSINNQIGVVALIEDGRAERLFGAEDLVLAKEVRPSEGEIKVFYIRRTTECRLLNTADGTVLSARLPLKDGLVIRTMLADGKMLAVEAMKKENVSFMSQNYVYLYPEEQLERTQGER